MAKKFERKEQESDSNPLSSIGNRKDDTNKFDIDEKTIKDQENKE